jgi:hypothetical protein
MMPLLFDADYSILKDCGFEYEEDANNRFLVIKNFPLEKGLYVANGNSVEQVEILSVIPSDYNTSGCDMFWVYPQLSRMDGKEIPNISGPGQDSRTFDGKEYCRWSRHWQSGTWKEKEDNIQKIIDRITWALKKPDANKI